MSELGQIAGKCFDHGLMCVSAVWVRESDVESRKVKIMEKTYPVPSDIAASAWINEQSYESMYRKSVEDNVGFWAEHGQRIDWIRPYSKVKDISFAKDDLHIRWYEDGTLNVCVNCIDRHLATRGDQTAMLICFTVYTMRQMVSSPTL